TNITISISASRYIQMRYKFSPELRQLLDEFVEHVNSSGLKLSEVYLVLAEAILSADWVTLNTDHYREAVRQFWKQGLLTGHYTRWFVILGKHINEDISQNLDL